MNTRETETSITDKRKIRRVNLTGQRFGKLTALKPVDIPTKAGSFWLCQCDCGNTTIANTANLKKGNTKSCGCLAHARKSPSTHPVTVVKTRKTGHIKDLTGQRFGKLIVIGYAGVDDASHALYRCQCDCGNTVVKRGSSLKSGGIKSCGCLRGQSHGDSSPASENHRIYDVWIGMRDRCLNPNAHGHEWYGDRGITVCDEWKDDYSKFKDWALAHGYKDSLSLDRIDVNQGYSPENCRWTTPSIQSINRQNMTRYPYHGLGLCRHDMEHVNAMLELGFPEDLIDIELHGNGSYKLLGMAKKLVGKRFGYWTVLKVASRNSAGGLIVECQCKCGTIRDVDASNLRSGRSKSCGCMKTEKQAKRSGASLPGDPDYRLYTAWRNMMRRKHIRNYEEGAPVDVCREWRDWKSFKAWSIAHGYTDDARLIRLNTDLGFAPDNCRWVKKVGRVLGGSRD